MFDRSIGSTYKKLFIETWRSYKISFGTSWVEEPMNEETHIPFVLKLEKKTWKSWESILKALCSMEET